MNAIVELNLALILFMPWYLLLGWLFWRVRARGASSARKFVALAIRLASMVAAGTTGVWAYGIADTSSGMIWRQILACVVGYWAFLVVLAAGYGMLRSPALGTALGPALQNAATRHWDACPSDSPRG